MSLGSVLFPVELSALLLKEHFYFFQYLLVALSNCFGFLPKILGGGGDIQMVLCHSINAGWVVGIPWGGVDTQTPPCEKESVWTFCTHKWRRSKSLVPKPPCETFTNYFVISFYAECFTPNLHTWQQWNFCYSAFHQERYYVIIITFQQNWNAKVKSILFTVILKCGYIFCRQNQLRF